MRIVKSRNFRLSRSLLFCLPLLLLLSTSLPLLAADYQYNDAWADHGLTLERESATGVELSFSIEQWSLGTLELDGVTRQTVQIPGSFLPNNAGAPNLPGQSRWLAIPNGATASVRIVDFRTETLTDVDLAPAPRIPLETEDGLEYPTDLTIYNRSALYPEQPVDLSPATAIRGVGAVMLGVTPFQYNPVTRELLVYRDLKIEITFSGGDGHFGEDRLRNQWWDPILQNTFLNTGSLEEVTSRVVPGSRTPDYEYLIICQNDPVFVTWANTLRVFRTEQGIRTGVVTIDEIGGNTRAAIEGYVDNAYANWDIPPVAVLLLGDYGDSGSPVGIFADDYHYDFTAVSDHYYADVSGNHLPDIAFARITANDETDLINTVGKGIAYEEAPPTNPAFYANPVIAGGWQTERWFILCDEVIYGFLANELGKTPVREYAIYSGSPGSTWSTATNTATVVHYFGPFPGLGYIPNTPGHLNDWGGNATRLNADINAGTFMVQHRDHGGTDGWGEPAYYTSSLSGLFNDDLTFVFSINCLTGKFDSSGDCFTEAFHRYPQRAVGLIAASETSYSFVNDTYVWGMFDFMWPDFMPAYGPTGSPEWGDPTAHRALPAFGNASGKYFLQASSWPYNTQNKIDTHYLFHHHGDAFLSMYTEVPQALTVAHDGALLSGVDYVTVTADAGALIGIAADGEYLGSATATGLPQNVGIPVQLPGGNIVVTVTKQNYFRYREEVPVVPPEGPYLIYSSDLILDADGDDDGELDEGETVGLEITLYNVGVEPATNVTANLVCADPFVLLPTANASYPDIPAGGYGTTIVPYSVQVDGTVPDGHVIPFQIDATADQGVWSSNFSLAAQAPVVGPNGQLEFSDANGNDVIEPGETIDLSFGLQNDGHSDAGELSLTLSSADPNLIIVNGSASCVALPIGGSAMTDDFRVELRTGCPEPSTITCQVSGSAPNGHSVDFEVSFPVGGWFDEMETDLGWTVGAAGDDATTGLWERADPVGTTYNGNVVQMEDDHTPAPGIMCFVTGNGSPGGAAGDADVDGGKTTLLSPVFDLTGATSVSLSYWRWYTNNAGNNPDEDWWNVDVTSNGIDWVSLEHTQTSLTEWTEMNFDLGAYITFTDHVQVRFIAEDIINGSLVEAGVDDFLLTAYHSITAVDDGDGSVPGRYTLAVNYPNPFNPATTISFSLPARGFANLSIFDLAGRRVRTLVASETEAGQHSAVWRGRDDSGRRVASGVYYYRLTANDFVATKKMMLVK